MTLVSAVAPALTVAGVGAEAEILKSGVVFACTVKLADVVCVREPELPVMVTL